MRHRHLFSAATAFSLISSAQAFEPAPTSELGQITVYAPRIDGSSLGGTTISRADVQQFNRDTLDTAIQLASGASVSSVGARNETNIWLRGFDRWRIPLYQDGIPIYLPVDNRIDFGRFSTLDLAEIQVSKGFASVIDGPGAMGGSINLVSRVVGKPLEVDARLGSSLDSGGHNQGWTSDVFVGSRQSQWYAQAAGSFTKQTHFRLSDDFVPGTFQGPGDRLGSEHKDHKINLKVGFTPSFGGEYAINFIDQVGSKGNPVVDSIVPKTALNQVRYWDWPSWNKKSYYFLSKNDLDDRGSYVKTRIYYDRFFNQLDSFDTIAYNTQNTPKSFNSTCDDRAGGGSVELSETLPGGRDTIRAAAHFRWDQHNETQTGRNAPFAPVYTQPWQTAQETTSSFALENIYRPTSAVDVVAGLSYDYRHLVSDNQWLASGVTPPFGSSFSYPVADKHALNGEIATIYRYGATGAVHASYADRSRFPTLFEMYSTRFGTFKNNPDLRPERSHYFQVGVADTVYGTTLVVNGFYAKVVDGIVAVPLSATLSESQNVGAEKRYGYEIEASRQVLTTLKAGVNYSHLTRVEEDAIAIPVDTPNQTLVAYAEWRPIERLAIVSSLDIEGKRTLQNAVNNKLYYQGGSFSLLNVKASYQFLPQAMLELGTTNVADRNYVIEDGYHAPGRQYFANLRVTF